MKGRKRKFRGYAVIERPDGALVWGTFRPTEAAARAAFEKWNPSLEGHQQQAEVLPVEIKIFDKIEPEMF